MKNQEYALGVRRGLPVGLGYFSVSFGHCSVSLQQVSSARAMRSSLMRSSRMR